MNRELKQTIVMVSHEQWHMQYFDRIIFIRDGVLDQEKMQREGKAAVASMNG